MKMINHFKVLESSFHYHIEIGVDKGCECIGFKHANQYLKKPLWWIMFSDLYLKWR